MVLRALELLPRLRFGLSWKVGGFPLLQVSVHAGLSAPTSQISEVSKRGWRTEGVGARKPFKGPEIQASLLYPFCY